MLLLIRLELFSHLFYTRKYKTIQYFLYNKLFELFILTLFNIIRKLWNPNITNVQDNLQLLVLLRVTCVDVNAAVGRLNEVVSLVTVFEELYQVTSPFWSRDKVNRGIRLFHEEVFSRTNVVVHSSAANT